jgi:hypothetical protein
MKTLTINTYSINELKELFPAAYKKVLKNWEENEGSGEYVPWADEIFESMKATIEAFNGTLKDWTLGLDGSYIKVEIDEDEEAIDKGWNEIQFVENKLNILGYTKDNGIYKFPGLCLFTGYCADEDFIEHVYKSVKVGDPLKEAVESLAVVYQKLIGAELESFASEESMLANYESTDLQFDKQGKRIINS